MRGRITLVAASVVALALLLGAVVFWLTLRSSLLEGVRAAAEQDAAALASQVEAGGTESLGDLGELDDDRIVLIVGGDGTVVGASDDAPRVAAESADGTSIRVDDETYLIAREDADDDAGDLAVIVGRSTEPAEDTLATVARLLAISVPLLVALVALTTWIVVGRSLAPVERMRRQVDAVTATTLADRIDEPRSDDEIARLARTLNGMLARLEASQATQRRFISDASHELKSPLATLRQYAEVARAHPDRIGDAELGEVVLEEGGRLERLVQGMLVLARADEGMLRPEPADVDLDDLLLEEARRVRGTGIAVDTSGVRAARVRGDSGLLAQLVRNLVDNAARHARTGIALAVSPDGHRGPVVLTVDDDGAGIPPAERARVFDRFVRLDDARARDTGGSGLGLAIAREIARAHGGSVAVEDAPSGGARLRVELPGEPSAQLA
ncbi:signal transduction histidine kinase [Agromyces flavus]|uniref:histidine kinase n=1 Tax=Agromyces flavus TaxID=589382 RepID=A0A1H1ZUY1_9MICO|nr:ATP-binding protein [Agromyces flavus]MCP2367286.1 signal transduction histidine kinase [Agromyces flavus]SDT37528.1 Signal transduction histidine kinase [Agromyces flavus]